MLEKEKGWEAKKKGGEEKKNGAQGLLEKDWGTEGNGIYMVIEDTRNALSASFHLD